MELVNYLQFYFFLLCALAGIIILFIIIILKKENQGIDYDKLLNKLNNQKKLDIQTLEKGNKEIDKLEKEILRCKKELKLKTNL